MHLGEESTMSFRCYASLEGHTLTLKDKVHVHVSCPTKGSTSQEKSNSFRSFGDGLVQKFSTKFETEERAQLHCVISTLAAVLLLILRRNKKPQAASSKLIQDT